MKNFKQIRQMVEARQKPADVKKIRKDLDKWKDGAIFDLNDDLWGESDSRNQRDEWNDMKNNVDRDDLISMAMEMMKNMETSYADFKDFQDEYK
jgi:hypothetical protein